MEDHDLAIRLIEIFTYQRQGETWKAMRGLKELTVNDSNNAVLLKLLGNVYFHMGLLDWAIDYYRQAIKVDPDYIDAHYDLGVALYHRARVNEAIAQFQRVLDLDPDYHAAHYRIALCYQHAGKVNAALHHFLESTVVTPEYVMAHYHLGEIYFEQGEFEKAEHAFKRVLREDPDDAASAQYLKRIAKRLEVVESS